MRIEEIVESNPEKLSGVLVFAGTRVPVQNLFDCLEEGQNLEDFLDQFPTVSREQAVALLETSKQMLLATYESAA